MSTAIRLKGLRERRATITAELRRLGDTIRAENRALSPEEKEKFDKLKADFTTVGNGIRSAEATLAEMDSLVAAGEGVGEGDEAAGRGVRPGSGYASYAPRRSERPDAETANLAFQAWARSQYSMPLTESHVRACRKLGVNPRAAEFAVPLTVGAAQYRGQTVGSDAGGGYLVPDDFSGVIERSMKAFGGVRDVATVRRVPTGRNILYPTVDDTGNVGELLAEAATVNAQDITFSNKTFAPVKISSKLVKCSYELLEDEAVGGLANQIGELLGERIGRSEGAYMTTGTGTSQPQGVVTGATAGLTAASATVIAGTEIVRLFHSVDPAYRTGPGVGFMLNDGILAVLAILVDSEGRPMFRNNFGEGKPDTLYGQPVFINQHMQATVATGTVTVLFGDFKKYHVVDAGELRIRRLEERYADTDEVGFLAFHRFDSRYINTAAVKKLTQA